MSIAGFSQPQLSLHDSYDHLHNDTCVILPHPGHKETSFSILSYGFQERRALAYHPMAFRPYQDSNSTSNRCRTSGYSGVPPSPSHSHTRIKRSLLVSYFPATIVDNGFTEVVVQFSLSTVSRFVVSRNLARFCQQSESTIAGQSPESLQS